MLKWTAKTDPINQFEESEEEELRVLVSHQCHLKVIHYSLDTFIRCAAAANRPAVHLCCLKTFMVGDTAILLQLKLQEMRTFWEIPSYHDVCLMRLDI